MRHRTQAAVARAKEGDPAGVRFLYVTFSNNVYGYACSIVRDHYEAEDVTQQVFAKLMTKIGRYDEQGVPFVAWLLRMTRNVAIDHLRKLRVVPTDWSPDPDMSSDADLDQAETVRSALATLPDEQRRVVLMRHVIGLSPGEIADCMRRSESSVHGLHHRGRRALQRELERLDATPSTLGPRRLAAA